MSEYQEPLLQWVQASEKKKGNCLARWDLVVSKSKRAKRSAATVWDNGNGVVTWHTWDRFGIGGENDVEHEETPEAALRRAKIEATASAVFQGFI